MKTFKKDILLLIPSHLLITAHQYFVGQPLEFNTA